MDAGSGARMCAYRSAQIRQNSDPFYGTNEKEVQWIDKKDWEYRTTFDIESSLYTQEHLELVFDGLDTYADVYVNDTHVLSADNMFRVWKADVKALVKERGTSFAFIFVLLFRRICRSWKSWDMPCLLPMINPRWVVSGINE